MRVLWFTNTPANSDEYFKSELKGTGGWLKALNVELQDKVDLHVGFYHHAQSTSFKYQQTTYHPIKRGNHYLEIVKSNFFHHVIDNNDIGLYLDLVSKVKPDIIHIHAH